MTWAMAALTWRGVSGSDGGLGHVGHQGRQTGLASGGAAGGGRDGPGGGLDQDLGSRADGARLAVLARLASPSPTASLAMLARSPWDSEWD
jgi:hypothetical protein